jgi:hypothetical protein
MDNAQLEMAMRGLRVVYQTYPGRGVRISTNKAKLAGDNAPGDVLGDGRRSLGSEPEAAIAERALVGVYFHYTAFMAAFRGLEIIGKRNGLDQILLGQELHISTADDASRYGAFFEDLRLHDRLFFKEWLVAFGERAPSLRGGAAFVQSMLIELASVDPSFRAVAGGKSNLAQITELTSHALQARQGEVARATGLRTSHPADPTASPREERTITPAFEAMPATSPTDNTASTPRADAARSPRSTGDLMRERLDSIYGDQGSDGRVTGPVGDWTRRMLNPTDDDQDPGRRITGPGESAY